VGTHTYNFSAGPATLPTQALENASKALLDFNGSGIGILCHSHRGAEFTKVIEATEARCRSLLGISDEYAVLFLQGGASLQFSMLPMNLLGSGKTADYINTGAWSQKAIKEAKREGTVHVAASSEDENFSFIPSDIKFSQAPAYVHYTSNNTIFGTEWKKTPAVPDGAELCCDASSNIFSKPLDVASHGVIYAGAQKNLGPAGVTLVIIKKSLAERAPKDVPTMLQYRTHVDKQSMYNTPPTFGIYVIGEVLKWLEDFGGVETMAAYNKGKADLLYAHLQESKCFEPTARADSRSTMNVCFRTNSPDTDAAFLKGASAKALLGLKGHRSVGGMRASIYNAFPHEGVEALVAFMKDFEAKN